MNIRTQAPIECQVTRGDIYVGIRKITNQGSIHLGKHVAKDKLSLFRSLLEQNLY